MRFPALLAALFAATTQAPLPAMAQDDLVGFDRGSFGRAVLNRNQSAGAGDDIQFELSVGDYNNEPITTYSSDSVFAKMGLSVGRLDILTDAGVFPCTAFIVDKKHILTNYHCVPGILDNERAKATRIDSVIFVAGYTQAGIEEGTDKYTVIPTPVEAHEDLDYAVLEVIGNPSAQYGTLKLASHTPHGGDPYWVIGHPMGEAQRISREKCRANKPAISGLKLLHTCDTLPGNSGSPVIDASLQAVVALHHAGSRKDAVNFAIPMTEILGRSNVLMAAAGGTGNPPKPGGGGGGTPPKPVETANGICDTLYDEAKAFAKCFAYEVYLEQCGTHRYAPFAKGFMNAQCSAPEGPGAPVDPGPTPVDYLRPWCANTALSPAQDVICKDAYLAGLDGEIEAAYGRQTHVSSPDQARWESDVRNGCGASASCLSEVMVERISYLKTTPVIEQPKPTYLRPWCNSARLNNTEATICASPYLAGLDEEMENAYARQSHVSSSAQGSWRTGVRDACGSSESCIGKAVIDRISYLRNPPSAPAPSNGVREVPGNYALGSTRCYIITASRPSLSEATAFVQEWFRGRDGVRIFKSNNGYYGITIATVAKSDADWRMNDMKSRRIIPSDSYCTEGGRFVAEIVRGSSSDVGTGTRKMYVGSRVKTGLNLRNSPSTSGGIITEIPRGDQVTVLRISDGWAQVRTGAGTVGWVSYSYLSGSKPAAVATPASCTARVINLRPYSSATRSNGSGFLNIRASASARSSILSETYLGDTVQVISQSGNWAKVRCVSGQCANPYRGTAWVTGWASKKYLSIRCQ